MQTQRKRTFILISAVILFLDLMFVAVNFHFARNTFLDDLSHEAAALHAAFRAALRDTQTNLLLVASVFANDEAVQDLFLQGRQAVEREGGGAGGERAAVIRSELYDLVAPRWLSAMQHLGARQLHFHLGPGSLSFLRVHKPEKFGDRLDDVRFTVVDVNRLHQPVSGFETGRVYSGIRGVLPVSARDPQSGERIHVGALEAGLSFHNILRNLEKATGAHAGVLLERSHIESAMWPEFIKMRFGASRKPTAFVVEATSAPLPGPLMDRLNAQARSGEPLDDKARLVAAGDRHFAYARFALRDYLGATDVERPDAGSTVLWRDVTDRLAAFEQNQWINLAYALLAYLLVEILLYLGFRQVTAYLERQVDERTGELARSQERLAEAQRIARLGHWEWDIPGNRLTGSDGLFRLFGLQPRRSGADPETFYQRVHPGDLDAVREKIQATLRDGVPYRMDHRVLLDSGEQRWVQERGELQRDESGRPHCLLGTVQDITERKLSEKALEELRDSLELQVDERTRELIEAKEAAEAANRAKSVFLANMSHELRTPLNAVLGFSQLMLRDPAASPVQRNNLEIINRSGGHLLELINQVLDLAKIEAGGMKLAVKPFDLQRLTGEVENLFQARCREKGLDLRVSVDEDVPRYLKGDAGKLRQLLTNLLGNAVKFTSRGYVQLRVSSDPERPLRLRFEVRDSGPGISPEELPRLFRPFSQTASGLKAGGTGLGLNLSRKFARLMGGEILVHSEPGRGSVFTLVCPLPAADRVPKPASRAGRRVVGLAPETGHPLVLVVDDQAENRSFLVQLLRSVGFRVHEADNGRSALDAFDAKSPDLVLMDIRMPVMDGLEATRLIRAREHGGDVPIIAVSADVLEDQRQRILESGVDTILHKPYTEHALFEQLTATAGIRFVCRQDAAPDRQRQPRLADGLAALPAPLRAQLRDAALRGNFTRLRKLSLEVARSDKDLADHLDQSIQRMEFERLAEMVSDQESAA